MSALERIRAWIRSPKRRRSRGHSRTEPLREFVYLDEVSVYSLLASRKSGVATQFTDSQTASLNSELGGSLKVGFGGIGSGLSSKSQTGQSQASQVIRKATVQDSFTELHDLERDNLSLTSPGELNQLNIETPLDIGRNLESLSKVNLVIDIERIHRGDLMEANIELEADPLFRMTMVITTLYELMADRPDIFGTDHATQLKQAYSVGQVLDQLLTGLVPIRGRLVDYEATTIGDKHILVHQTVKNQLDSKFSDDFQPLYLTGVAHQDLFWKDIRQILFSESRYRVFCRLATAGLKEDWQPVKIVDLFEGVIPQFREAIDSASEIARQLMEGPDKIETIEQYQAGNLAVSVIKEFVRLLEEFHQKQTSSQLMEERILPAVPTGDWVANVLDRRAVFDTITELVDQELNVETPGEERLSLRNKALRLNGSPEVSSEAILAKAVALSSKSQREKFLDTEIVAIYW